MAFRWRQLYACSGWLRARPFFPNLQHSLRKDVSWLSFCSNIFYSLFTLIFLKYNFSNKLLKKKKRHFIFRPGWTRLLFLDTSTHRLWYSHSEAESPICRCLHTWASTSNYSGLQIKILSKNLTLFMHSNAFKNMGLIQKSIKANGKTNWFSTDFVSDAKLAARSKDHLIPSAFKPNLFKASIYKSWHYNGPFKCC